jgi:transposase
MNIVYERCAGLDVHKRSVAACAITPDAKGQRHKEHESFSTMTPDVLRLRHWLTTRGVTHVVMESTGVFWQPIYALLEGILNSCWSMHSISKRYRDARPM